MLNIACYHPLYCYKTPAVHAKTGKPVYAFVTAVEASRRGLHNFEQRPCNQCIGCRLEYSRRWAVRCVHEAQMHDKNCYLTLTYDPEHLPKDGSLNLRDIQLFFKRLRDRVGPLRYFQCGEYGEAGNRPHHHAVVFGYDFPDKVYHSTSKSGFLNYTSEILTDVWSMGLCTVGDVSFESCAYVARYVTKKVTGKGAEAYYGGRKPEYATMSRTPGIARGWFDKFSSDVYPFDEVVLRGGKICRPPRYYDELYNSSNPDVFAGIKAKRVQVASENLDNTPERLEVREKIKKIKAQRLKRSLEND